MKKVIRTISFVYSFRRSVSVNGAACGTCYTKGTALSGIEGAETGFSQEVFLVSPTIEEAVSFPPVFRIKPFISHNSGLAGISQISNWFFDLKTVQS